MSRATERRSGIAIYRLSSYVVMATVLFACVTLLATTYFYDYVRSI